MRLPYQLDVIPRALQMIAFRVGIIQANIRDFDLWMCSHLVNTYQSFGGGASSFEGDIWDVNEGMIDQKVILPESKGKDLIEQHKAMLQKGYYVLGFYDEYFIAGKKSYGKESFLHDYILIGYDDEKQVLNSIGYIDEINWDFFDITYEDYIRSIERMTGQYEEIEYIRFCKEYIPRIDSMRMRELMGCYLESKEDPKHPWNPGVYGFQVWEQLAQKIGDKNVERVEITESRCYMEHRQMMQKRLMTLQKLGVIQCDSLIQAYEKEVRYPARIVHLMCMKYIMCRRETLRSEVKDMMKEINDREYQILKEIMLNWKG